MSQEAEPPQSAAIQTPFDLTPGLLEYYSSQANLMLMQHDNIKSLLGRTNNYTASGDLCEILLRDIFRKFLPPRLSVDKGFFHGRAIQHGKDIHCPEIDILIHDSQTYPPLYRMGDFVVVQPKSVRGIMQVKRNLSDKQLRRGFRNVVMAKQLLLDVLWNGRCWHDRSSLPPPVFSAIVGFGDETTAKATLHERQLKGWARRMQSCNRSGLQHTNTYVLPSFVGSIQKRFVFLNGSGSYTSHQYALFNSTHGKSKINVFVQSLLLKFYQVMFIWDKLRLPFPDMQAIREFTVSPK